MVPRIHHLSDTIRCQVTHPGAAQKTPLFFFLRFTCLFWPRWVFLAAYGLSLVAETGGYSPVAVRGLLIVVVPRLSYPSARAIFPDQGLSPRPLHRQADSYPLDHQGSLWPWLSPAQFPVLTLLVVGKQHPCFPPQGASPFPSSAYVRFGWH